MSSKLDITYFVGVYSRFQAAPKKSYLQIAMKILRYLKGTQAVGLWHSEERSFDLVDYSNADFARYKVYQMSTFGTC